MAYSKDSEWRNRSVFVKGRSEIKEFLTDKWKKELDYKLEKRYWWLIQRFLKVLQSLIMYSW